MPFGVDPSGARRSGLRPAVHGDSRSRSVAGQERRRPVSGLHPSSAGLPVWRPSGSPDESPVRSVRRITLCTCVRAHTPSLPERPCGVALSTGACRESIRSLIGSPYLATDRLAGPLFARSAMLPQGGSPARPACTFAPSPRRPCASRSRPIGRDASLAIRARSSAVRRSVQHLPACLRPSRPELAASARSPGTHVPHRAASIPHRRFSRQINFANVATLPREPRARRMTNCAQVFTRTRSPSAFAGAARGRNRFSRVALTRSARRVLLRHRLRRRSAW